MTKRKTPLQEVLERGAPEYCLFHCRCAILVSSTQASAGFLSINSTICSQGLISRLSETPSLLDLRHTLGNDSVLQCALHQYLNGSYWYSVASPVADSAPDKRRINSKRAGNNFPLFSACPFLGCDRRRNTY